MKFTLKVIFNKKTYQYYPNEKHFNGGKDLKQIVAFNHLFPKGYCDELESELLFWLVGLHNWDIEITKI